MFLFINTSDYEHTRFALVDETSIVADEVIAIPHHESYKTLGYIDGVLKERDGRALERIVVATGPGAFTGVRVGVALAQGLGMAWGVPVVGVATAEIPDDLIRLNDMHAGDTQIRYAALKK